MRITEHIAWSAWSWKLMTKIREDKLMNTGSFIRNQKYETWTEDWLTVQKTRLDLVPQTNQKDQNIPVVKTRSEHKHYKHFEVLFSFTHNEFSSLYFIIFFSFISSF